MTTQVLKNLRMVEDDNLMNDGMEEDTEEVSEDLETGSSDDISNDEEEEEEF
ncbi:MAG: hypothetical protein Q8L36_02335 [bacterium]|nr:hypothetical protein [bacterium]